MRLFEGLPLWAATAVLSAILVLGIYLTDVLRIATPLVAAIVLDAIIAWLYLREYQTRPMEERPPAAAPGSVGRSIGPGAVAALTAPPITPPSFVTPPQPPEDEEFDDPVIEADEIDSGRAKPESETTKEEAPPS